MLDRKGRVGYNKRVMRTKTGNGRTIIRIPWAVFESAESKEELEDWLLAHNPAFLARMRQARREDMEGKCRSLKEAARRLRIKSS